MSQQQRRATEGANFASSFLYCFTQTNIGTYNQLVEKLKDMSEGASQTYPSGTKGSFSHVKKGPHVMECVVAETHVACLLKDGTVCRMRYVEEEPGPFIETKDKSDDDAASTSSARSRGSRSASPRGEGDERGPSSFGHSWSTLIGSIVPTSNSGASGSSGLSRFAGRGARIQLLRRRGGGRALMARWPVVPASEVPEGLISQAMAVLQGKSRESVIRELQRTNLDVNQAVNNLLSRDDDDGEHEETIAAFLPSGEELLNLLGGVGAVGEDEIEEALGRAREEGGRESRIGVYDMGDPLLQVRSSEIRSLVGMARGGRPSGSSGSGGAEGSRRRHLASTGGKEPTVAVPLLFDEGAQWWAPEEADCRFVQIAGLYSDLLAVDNWGRLHVWAWQSYSSPSRGPHPLEAELGLVGEKIRLIAGKLLRASIVTESGKLATWLDRSVSSISSRLEHKAQTFLELAGETVSQLHVCELFSVILTESNKIFWWGMLPFSERKQAILQTHERVRMAKYKCGLNGKESIVQGSRVCLRSSPVYTVGTRAVHLQGGEIKCGVLQESVFVSSLSEKCRFKVLGPDRHEESMDTSTADGEDFIKAILGAKRKHPDDAGTSSGGSDGSKDEFWSLRDVIFMDCLQTLRAGTVLKVDGGYAAVHFPALEPEEIEEASLDNCRLLRKDDLILASEAQSQQTPYFTQESLKRLKSLSCYHPLALACDCRGIHGVFSAHSLVHYIQYNMGTGRFMQNMQFSETTSRYFLRQSPPVQLIPEGAALWLIRDASGGLYPIVKDSVGAMKDPPLLNLPPVTAMCVGSCSTESSVTVLAFKKQSFMQLVLKGDLSMIKHHLEGLADNPRALRSALCEWSGGECNILHVLTSLGKPPDPPMTSSDGGRGPRGVAARTTPHHGRLRELMKHARAMASGNMHSQPPFDPCVWVGDDVEEHVEVTSCTGDAVRCVEWLYSFTPSHVVLAGLMKEKNIEGYTPFMAATSYKAYGIALKLFDLALMLSGASEDSLVAMLCPPDSHPDDNPVFVLCRNDTCSFTWTGEEHIHQDIFECRTCGLTGSLCCCTECAYTCHRGHDCSFKRSSPTAYCDCWEKCKCKALVSVPDSQRQSLLIKLLKHTSLGTRVNGRKEHLLGMLVGIVARQAKEQNQWHSLRSSSSYRMHSSKHEDMPPHDLPPPKFAQKALNMVMEDWQCVKTALLAGVGDLNGDLSAQVPPQPKTQTAWGRGCDSGQSCTLSLDALTHTLLTKINQEMLDSLLTRLVKKIGPLRQNKEAVDVCERFLRSVVRVFTTCHIEATNIPSSTLSSSSKKRSASSTLVERSERVFSSLAPLAVKQLVPMAQALILPVCGGVSRPVDPQCMSDRHRAAEELFRLPALSLLRIPTTEEDHAEGEAGSDTESDGGDGEESTSGGLAHDASSTATIGSNPLYLSDQDSSDGEELESGPDDASIDGDSRPDEDSLMVHTPTHRLTTAHSTSHWALPTVHRTHTSSTRLSRTSTYSSRDCLSMSMSSTLLAQTFSLLVRQLADIMEAVQEHLHSPTPPSTLPTLEGEPEKLAEFMWAELHEVWVWLFSQLDTVECQIRLGTSVEGKVSDRATSSRLESSTEILESRKDFLSYLLSLMRGQHREHGGVLPAIDVSAMEHLAWTMDALYYILKNTQPSDSTPMDVSTPLNQPEMARFFRRSSSTTLLGALPISPFDPLSKALPLADKPHLLDPEHYRPVLFGYDQATLLEQWPQCCLQDPPIISLIRGTADRGLGLGALWPKRGKEQEIVSNSESSLTLDRVCGLNSHDLAADVLVGRWNSTVRLFARVFGDSVGRARGSYLSEERVFETLERDFRREMDSLRTSCQKEIIIEVERSRDRMIPATFNQLNSFYDSRLSMNTATPPLCVYRVKVSFLNEPGEGSGVLRSLLTAIAEAVLSDDPLPKLDSPLRIKKPLSPSSITISVTGKGKVREKQKANSKSGSQGSRLQTTERYLGDDPLFYQPGKPGFYAPRCSTNTPERLNAYRNVGRLIGLSLLNCETIPLLLCRHVFKYLMNKEVSWHDLAFFDPVMYESLRQLILDSRGKNGQEHLASQQLTFQVTLRAEEGGGVRELVMHGASLPVTPDNVYDYVRKYAELRMLTVNKEPLQQLRDGVYDVIPENSLVGLSAEYLRLLVSGCPQIDVDLLRGITIFDDESHKSPETLVRFKNWFWSVVERMSQRERQDLLYFWTSSPQLPASMESYQPSPSVTVRPADDQRLPTANTCISRIYIPLYSSKVLLRTRLLMAIKTKTFGFV